MKHLNNGGFAYDGFFRYSGVSLYMIQIVDKSLAPTQAFKFHSVSF